MLDAETVDRILQKKMDSLAAKRLHVRAVVRLRRYSRLIDALALAVPILYVPVQSYAQKTAYAREFEMGWGFLAALLVVATALKLIYGLQDRAGKAQ